MSDVSKTLNAEHGNASCCERTVLAHVLGHVQTLSATVQTQSIRLPLQLISQHKLTHIIQRRRQQLHSPVAEVRHEDILVIINRQVNGNVILVSVWTSLSTVCAENTGTTTVAYTQLTHTVDCGFLPSATGRPRHRGVLVHAADHRVN